MDLRPLRLACGVGHQGVFWWILWVLYVRGLGPPWNTPAPAHLIDVRSDWVWGNSEAHSTPWALYCVPWAMLSMCQGTFSCLGGHCQPPRFVACCILDTKQQRQRGKKKIWIQNLYPYINRKLWSLPSQSLLNVFLPLVPSPPPTLLPRSVNTDRLSQPPSSHCISWVRLAAKSPYTCLNLN